jgi:hypothetical protein
MADAVTIDKTRQPATSTNGATNGARDNQNGAKALARQAETSDSALTIDSLDQSENTEQFPHWIDPSLIIPAVYPLDRVIGQHKDDPYAAEVWERILASRHPERASGRKSD